MSPSDGPTRSRMKRWSRGWSAIGPLCGFKREFRTRWRQPHSGPRRAKRAKERLANQPRACTVAVGLEDSKGEALGWFVRRIADPAFTERTRVIPLLHEPSGLP